MLVSQSSVGAVVGNVVGDRKYSLLSCTSAFTARWWSVGGRWCPVNQVVGEVVGGHRTNALPTCTNESPTLCCSHSAQLDHMDKSKGGGSKAGDKAG
jgi:hypothetical protein